MSVQLPSNQSQISKKKKYRDNHEKLKMTKNLKSVEIVERNLNLSMLH